ncbi:MAG: glycoside hydrolase family 25 protein [Clostridiales bacterium]|nr:glycoside hydrolase family 25 protein [Clostridiales bacterium]
MKSYRGGVFSFIKNNRLMIVLLLAAVVVCVLAVFGVIYIVEHLSAQPETIVTSDTDTGEKISFSYGTSDNQITVDVLSDVEVNTLNNDNFTDIDGLKYYIENGKKASFAGIDVSEFQHEINWAAVKQSGIEFAMIRAGFRGSTEGGLFEDGVVRANIEGAINNGIEVGLYFFSQATSEQEAVEEAKFLADIADEYSVTYPLVFDWERNEESDSRTLNITPAQVTKFASAFCKEIEKRGYTPMIYYNEYYGYMLYDLSEFKDHKMWYVQYSDTPSFYYGFDMWQYTENGQIDGIDGTVDINVYFER